MNVINPRDSTHGYCAHRRLQIDRPYMFEKIQFKQWQTSAANQTASDSGGPIGEFLQPCLEDEAEISSISYT